MQALGARQLGGRRIQLGARRHLIGVEGDPPLARCRPGHQHPQ
jgi:hypothetical protein